MELKELQLFIENVSNEKGVSREVIIEALEGAMASSMRKKLEKDPYTDVRVELDEKAGRFRAYKVWVPEQHRVDAQGEDIHPDDVDTEHLVEEEIPIEKLSRIGAQSAKQIIVQKVRDAKRQQLAENYQFRIGDIFQGVVKRVTRERLIVEIDNNVDAILPRENLLPHEYFRVNDRVRAVLEDVRTQDRGNQLVLSRTGIKMLKALFTQEVPEIADQAIEICAIAREAGQRAKIAVKTNDRRIDPIGACVGLRGSRVQFVSDEMGGEKIDIIEWNDSPAECLINALAPLEVVSIVIDEDAHSIDVSIPEENLAQAIGSNGQNVRLISELIGWSINIVSEKEANEKMEEEVHSYTENLQKHLDIDEAFAETLISHGFVNLDNLAYVPVEELTVIDGVDEDIALELQNRAKNALLDAGLEQVEMQKQYAEDMFDIEGMTAELAQTLANAQVQSREEVADLAASELLEITTDLTQEQAEQLIMSARAPWFEKDGNT